MTTENIVINIREDGARVVQRNIRDIGDAADSVNSKVHSLVSGMSFFNRALSVLAIGATIKGMIEMADNVTLLEARLRLAAKGADDFNRAQKDIYRIAQSNNVAIKETTQLYTKLYDPIRRLGGGTAEVTSIVDAFATSLRIGGANARESASATLQFAQAMGSGKLAGDEFRSMAENAPRFMKALADGLGVPIGALKQMSAEGKLTSDVIGNALMVSLAQLKQEAAGLQDTVGGAFTRLVNDTTIMVGEFNKLTGTSNSLANGIGGVSELTAELGKVFRDELADGTKLATSGFDNMAVAIRIIGTLLERTILLASDISYTFNVLGIAIGGAAAQIRAIATGDWSSISGIRTAMREDLSNLATEHERFQGRISSMTSKVLERREALKGSSGVDTRAEDARLLSSGNSLLKLSRDTASTEKDLLETRMRLAGINKTYFEDMNSLQSALASGNITQKEYVGSMTELAIATYKNSKAGKEARAGLKQEETDYTSLIKTIREKDAVVLQSLSVSDKLSAGQKLAAKFSADIANGDIKLVATRQMSVAQQKQMITLSLEKLIADERELTLREENQSAIEKMADSNAKELSDINAQVLKQTEYNETIGLTKDAIGDLEMVKLNNQALQKDEIANLMDLIDWSGKLGDKYREQAAAFRELAAAKQLGGVKQQHVADMAAEDIRIKKVAENAIRYWKEAGTSISDSMSKAFGSIGKPMGSMFKAMTDGIARQLTITKNLHEETKSLTKSDPERYRLIEQAQREQTQSQLRSYADMAEGASGFFDSQSKGYKVMQAVSKSFHVAEIAMQIAGIAPKLASGAATMFGQSGWGGFAGVAAMGAVMAGLGVAMSSNTGQTNINTAAEVQKKQGTGTVFGDAEAKSESISKSIELLSKNSELTSPATLQMANSLKNIESSMVGLANIIFRSAGISDSSNMGIRTGQLNAKGSATDSISNVMTHITNGLLGPILGNKVSAFINNLWGKTTASITDSGLQIGGSVADLQQGKGVNQYANVATTSSSWFGLKKSTSNTLQTQGVSDEISQQFGKIFTNLQGVLVSAATVLGKNGDDVAKAVQSFVLDTTKISLTGLKGDDLQNAITGVISGALDTISQSVFPEFDKFRQVGEGYAETIIRIANNYASLDVILNNMNKTFGAVGMSSVAAREELILLAGGIDRLSEDATFFTTNFLTPAEQIAPVIEKVGARFKELNLTGITSMDQFKQLVLSQDLTTTSGREMYVALLQLAPAFKQMIDYTTELGKTGGIAANVLGKMNEAASAYFQQIDKQKEIADLSGTATSVLDTFFNVAIDTTATNTAAAQSALTAAQASNTAAQSAADAWKRIVSTLKTTLEQIRNQTATLLPDNYETSLARFNTLTTLARGGDADSAGKLSEAAQTFLASSKEKSLTTADYLRDRYKIENSLQTSLGNAETMVTAQDLLVQNTQATATAAQNTVTQLTATNNSLASLNANLTGFAKDVYELLSKGYGGTTRESGEAMVKTLSTMTADKNNFFSGTKEGGVATFDTGATVTRLGGDMAQFTGAGGVVEYIRQSESILELAKRIPELRAIWETQYGIKLPAFANGGSYMGGMAMVGERGPELINFAQGGHVSTAPQTSTLMAANEEIIKELRSIHSNLDDILSENEDMARDIRKLKEVTVNVTHDGEAMQTTPAT